MKSNESKAKHAEGVAKQEPNVVIQDYTLPCFKRKNRKEISTW